MDYGLTSNVIMQLQEGTEVDNPTVQVLALYKQKDSEITNYKFMISDGHQAAMVMLSEEANQFVLENSIECYSVITLTDYELRPTNTSMIWATVKKLRVDHCGETINQIIGPIQEQEAQIAQKNLIRQQEDEAKYFEIIDEVRRLETVDQDH